MINALKLLFITLLFTAGVSVQAASVEGEASVFDFTTFQEMNAEAKDLWKALVREKGSERAAVEAILLKNSTPDARLIDLHARVAQLVDSSYFLDSKISSASVEISSLMRFVLFNVSASYGKEIRPRVRVPLLTLKRDETAWALTGHAVWCATNSKNDHLFQVCSKSLGEDVYFYARKAGRASVLAHLYSGELQVRSQQTALETVERWDQENKNHICTGAVSSAWLAYATIYDEFILRNPFKTLRQVSFQDLAERCYQNLSPEERKYQKSLIPNKYESIIEISSAYFPKTR